MQGPPSTAMADTSLFILGTAARPLSGRHRPRKVAKGAKGGKHRKNR